MTTKLLLALAILATSAHAQTWLKVASEGDSISTTAIIRYGAPQGATASAGTPCALVGGCWVQLSVSGPFVANNAFFKSDPINGTAKEVDVLETTSAQVVIVNGKAITVPALPVAGTVPTVNTITFSTTINFNGTNVSATCSAPVVKQ